MSTEEIERENQELNKQVTECQKRIAALKEQIHQLNTAYDTAKRRSLFHRERLLRAMVKNAIEHPVVTDNYVSKLSRNNALQSPGS